MKINVLTLNCWGIPFVSKNRKERMESIAEYLSQGTQDIVCLQEVWDEKDYFFIKDKACDCLPYSHYFYSGVFGSGICIFSKWQIESVFYHAWSLNGYFHMVHHGDWFGGKGVGLCRIKCHDFYINVYSAHLHAEYSVDDIYLAHRVLQAFDTAEFIKMTSHCADLVILAGDLNTQPNELAFKFICEGGFLNDTYMAYKANAGNVQDKKKSITIEGTNERASNSYTNLLEALHVPEGKRIDYILYHSGKNYSVKVNKYEMPISGNAPGYTFSYSDHDAVAAQLEVTKVPSIIDKNPPKDYIEILAGGIAICHEAMNTLHRSAFRYLLYASCIFILLLFTVGMANQTFIDIARILIVAVMFYFLFMGTIWNRMERNGILAGRQAMEVIYDNLTGKTKK